MYYITDQRNLIYSFPFMPTSKTDYRITPDETWIIKAIAIMAMLLHHLFLAGPEYGQVAYVLARAGIF